MKRNILMLVVVALTLSSCLGGETPKEGSGGLQVNKDNDEPQVNNMLYTDTTKTAPLTFRELYKLNNPNAPEPDQEVINEMARQFMKSQTAITSPKKHWEETQNRLVSQHRDAGIWAEELNKVGYGESKYDARLMPSDENLEDLQKNRALNQTTGEKLLNIK